MNSPISYLGGKSRLADRIVSIINKHPHRCYCEPFCGAAWVMFRKAASPVEVINDADGELITFWRVIQNHLEEFLRYFKFALVSRHLFDLATRSDPQTLTDIQKAVRYFYLQRNGFGGKTHGRTFGTSATSGPSLNLSSINDVLLETHWRLKGVTIEHLDACECIRRYDRPETLFYIDPPYFGTAGYSVPFKTADYSKLKDRLVSIKGTFILSLNDVPEVRAIFSGFSMQRVMLKYCISNARTAGHGRNVLRKEVIITNRSPSSRRKLNRDHSQHPR